MRDNFSGTIKRTLQTRVGHVCSNPDCRRPTAGPGSNPDATVNIGVAAHITAASPGTTDRAGPRYDKSLTPTERSGYSNGIWLCQNCAKLIDSDIPRFSAELLRKWKSEAEQQAFLALSTSTSRTGVSFAELDDADRTFLRDLALPAEEDVEVVTSRLEKAAQEDLAAFRGTRDWPSNAIELDLFLNAGQKRHSISLAGIANAIGVADTLSIVSPPGTGKTTTLIQLANKIIDCGKAVPLLVPVGEWSSNQQGFLEFVAGRNAFRNFREHHFRLLAFYGRLVLLVDGWNEADGPSQLRAMRQLNALHRDFPLLSVVIATRRQAVPSPPGRVIEIAPLSEEQQSEIARRFPGGSRESVLDQAWRTPGIRELIGTPLYLSALLDCAPGSSFPKTKDEMLGAFVEQHESAPERATSLRTALFGCHAEMLIGLGVQANDLANTTIPDERARRAISHVGARLTSNGQLTACPQPSVVLDALVSGHLLVRASNGGVSFQHQQFQEWYASCEVERLMLAAASDVTGAKARLRTEVLDRLPWEESILFACERLSRENAGGAKAVGAAITEALRIDPMLAAEMILRSSETAWEQVKAEVLRFVGLWHQPGCVDRATRFMITTGRPEFAAQIRPLVASPDEQVHLKTLRQARYFRPSVLGAEPAKWLSELPDAVRASVVGSIAYESGFDGLELATQVAKADPSADVVLSIIYALDFRRAERQVSEVLQSAPQVVWNALAAADHGVRLRDLSQRSRLAAARAAKDQKQNDPIRAILRLADTYPRDEGIGERIAGIIESGAFHGDEEYAAIAIKRAMDCYPGHTKRALLKRAQAGLGVPYRTEEFLKGLPVVDEGMLPEAVLEKSASGTLARLAPTLIGPRTIGKVMDRALILHEKGQEADWRVDEATREEYHRLKKVLAATHLPSFIQALLERAVSRSPRNIQFMADLLAGHETGAQEMQVLPEDLRHSLEGAIQGWIGALLGSRETTRHQLADVVRAIERLPQPQFADGLARMLQRDFADWERAREEFKKLQRRGPINPDVSMSYRLQYQRAFAAIGGDQVVALMKNYLPDKRFGVEAAVVLSDIWARENLPATEPNLYGWNNFALARANRLMRRDGQNPPPSSEPAEAIFGVVRALGTDKSDRATQEHAIKLATVALRLPHGSKRAEIDALMGLPLPFATKRGLLMATAETGEILRAHDLIAGVQELLEASKREPWRLDAKTGELMGWLVLFLFSDKPARLTEILETLPKHCTEPWDLDRLLIAVADSPHDDAVAVFKALADRDNSILNNDRWIFSVLRAGTEAAANLIVDMICEGRLPARDGFPTRQFAEIVKQYPSVRRRVLQQYEKLKSGKASATLESILVESTDAEVVLALVRNHGRNGQGYDGTLAHVLEETAVGKRRDPNWPSAYSTFSVALTDLRKELFAMVLANGRESAIALACLNEIDRLRDEHGRVNDEPRHPDIRSDHPWPFLSGLAHC